MLNAYKILISTMNILIGDRKSFSKKSKFAFQHNGETVRSKTEFVKKASAASKIIEDHSSFCQELQYVSFY